MKKYYFFLLLTFFVLTTNYVLLSGQALLRQDSGGQVISASSFVSLYLGEHNFTLWGYTSPKALVTIEGMGIYDQTFADSKGKFEFSNRFSPFSPREACLTATDQFGRNSSPTCLPPFPTNRDVTIGPILLAPTLSLNPTSTGEYFMGDEVLLSGQTVPNSKVDLSIFTKDKSEIRISNFQIAKPVEAFTIPQLDIKSDDKGNFSISLPSENAQKYRFFAQTYYSKSPSGRSTTINLTIYPIWMIIIRFFIFLFELLKPHLIEIIILLQTIALAIYTLRHFFQPHVIARSRALALRENITAKLKCPPSTK